MQNNKIKRFFLELLWLKTLLPSYYKHLCILTYGEFLSRLKLFISDYTYNFLENAYHHSENGKKLLSIVEAAYNKKPSKYPLIKILTSEPIKDQEIHTLLNEAISEKFPEGFIISIVDRAIIGGCMIEIDGVKFIDTSYKNRLNHIMSTLESKLKCF